MYFRILTRTLYDFKVTFVRLELEVEPFQNLIEERRLTLKTDMNQNQCRTRILIDDLCGSNRISCHRIINA